MNTDFDTWMSELRAAIKPERLVVLKSMFIEDVKSIYDAGTPATDFAHFFNEFVTEAEVTALSTMWNKIPQA